MKKTLPILLILLILLTGGYFSYQYWQDHKTKPTTNVTTSTSSATDPSEGGKYLVIKEWGVRFEVPIALRGSLSYSLNDQAYHDFGGPILVNVTSSKFSNTPACASPKPLLSLEGEEVNGPRNTPQPFKTLANKRFYMHKTSCEETLTRAGDGDGIETLNELKHSIQTTLN